jgi:lactoylglutathione lyase
MTRLSHFVVFVSDMDRSVAFYRDVLGLPLRYPSPKWSEFATEGVTLALHLADTPDTTPHAHASMPAGHCQFGLTVADLDAFHAEMTAKGVACLQPPKSEAFGRLAIYTDPDGLPFSVTDSTH